MTTLEDNSGSDSQPLYSEHLPYPMSKTHVAFLMAAEKLFRIHKRVYFWTFTFKEVYCDWQYPPLFKRILLDVGYHFIGSDNGGLQGLRVVERHVMHGLHYHLLINERIPIELLKRLGRRYGLGRVSVRKANQGDAFYLAKYLTKEKEKFWAGGGVQLHTKRWSGVGGFRGPKKNDIIVDSAGTRCMRWFTKHCGKLPFRVAQLAYTWGSMYGEPFAWDMRTKHKFWSLAYPTFKREESRCAREMWESLFRDMDGKLRVYQLKPAEWQDLTTPRKADTLMVLEVENQR